MKAEIILDNKSQPSIKLTIESEAERYALIDIFSFNSDNLAPAYLDIKTRIIGKAEHFFVSPQ